MTSVNASHRTSGTQLNPSNAPTRSSTVVLSPAALVAMAGSSMEAFDKRMSQEAEKQRDASNAQRVLSELSSVFSRYQKGVEKGDYEDREPKMRAMKSAIEQARNKLPPDSPYHETINRAESIFMIEENKVTKSSKLPFGIKMTEEDFSKIDKSNTPELKDNQSYVRSPDGTIKILERGQAGKISENEIRSIQDLIRSATDDISTQAQRGMAELNDMMSKRANMIEMTKNITQALMQGATMIAQNAPR